jgi:hypothetical protein
MAKALKIIFLFQKPDWDDYRAPYIFFSLLAWAEVISVVIGIIKFV